MNFKLTDMDFSNHHIIQRNRKPSRVHFIPFPTEWAALERGGKSERIESLNGEWDFEWFPSSLDVTCTTIMEKPLKHKIIVPLNWQCAGFGKYNYTDIWYPFPVDPPHVPANNETGVYKKKIYVTREMTENLSIRFEGVESAFHLYVNGKLAGYSQGSRMPSEFDITCFVEAGENELCIVVYQYSDATYMEDQDMIWMGGIIRDVYLITRKSVSIKNVILDPDYNLETGEGVLNVYITANGSAKAAVRVYRGNELMKEFLHVPCGVRTQLCVEGVLPWTAETPDLYCVTCSVSDRNGVCEVVPQRIGFRHIAIEEGTLLLNGQRIFMKGINRHEYNMKTGRAITYQETYDALMLIKSGNMNAVRTSHYPNNPFMYDICNEIGLYVIDECDLETHGFEIVDQRSRLCGDKDWEHIYIDRIERMVQRDRNHACIVMWSLGNESWFGDNFRAMYDWCKSNEPMRPVHYQEDFKNEIVDVSSTMYSTVGELKELDSNVSPKRPHILCEFAHAMGNGPGNLKEYMEVCENSERIQGIFMWEFRDQPVYHKREDGKVEYLFGGEFGEKFHNGNYCLDGIIMADGTPSPGFYEYKKVLEYAHVLKFDRQKMSMTLKNRFDFLSFEKVHCICKITCDQRLVEEFEVVLPRMNPHEVKNVDLGRCLEDYESNALVALELTFIYTEETPWSSANTIIGTHQTVLYDYVSGTRTYEGKASCDWVDNRIEVKGRQFSFYVSLADGRIYDYQYLGSQLIHQGPVLNFDRAYIDNDINHKSDWNKNHLHSMQMTVYSAEQKTEGNAVYLTLSGRFAPKGMGWGANVTIVYAVLGDGTVNVSYEGVFEGTTPKELPKIGSQMRISKKLNQVTYCGYGPGENYCDSREAAKYGIYSCDYSQMETAYPCPQENGNRTNVRFAVFQGAAMGIALASCEGKDFSVHDVEDEVVKNSLHYCDLVRSDNLVVNIDMKNSGIGSGACGPDAMIQYKVYPVRFAFSFAIAPTGCSEAIPEGRKAMDCNAMLSKK